MVNELSLISSQLGMSLWILSLLLIWEIGWKLIAMWKSARNNSVTWFICLGIFNTIGILPILYIYVFSKKKKPNIASEKKISEKNSKAKKK